MEGGAGGGGGRSQLQGEQLQSVGITPFTVMDRLNICIYEFIGTAMLVLGYNFTNAGLAVCMNLFVGILLAQKISGGMFNPAVTVAIYITEGTLFNDLQLILMIICFQILGGYFGIIMGHFCVGEPAFLCPFEGRAGCLTYDEGDAWMKVFLLEFWCTFFFCLCILCQIFTRTQDSQDGVLQAAAISVTLFAMIQFAGPISGGCFNPAFGITQTTYQVGYLNSLGFEGKAYQKYMWLYICAPFCGGIVAALFMRFVHNPNLGFGLQNNNQSVNSSQTSSINGKNENGEGGKEALLEEGVGDEVLLHSK